MTKRKVKEDRGSNTKRHKANDVYLPIHKNNSDDGDDEVKVLLTPRRKKMLDISR